MTGFYLTFQLVSNAPHVENVHVRDNNLYSGTISYLLKTGKFELYIRNSGKSQHNSLHQARQHATKILRQVYEVTNCYNN